MNIETTLWFNMKRGRLLKYILYYEFKQYQESFNTVRHCIYWKGSQEKGVYSDV